ncbi:hypothetical protein WG922_13590 [Ramlibacter sp. AN1015]|uniref:hypothetical protein n=1 Tax=Ramlibacter sp. AN1015 TaxID=3133428 RepID=UPI0030C32269
MDTQTTSGFYAYQGELLFAPNYVLNKHFELWREHKDTYTYPVHGWTWFDSEEEASAALVPPQQEEEQE